MALLLLLLQLLAVVVGVVVGVVGVEESGGGESVYPQQWAPSHDGLAGAPLHQMAPPSSCCLCPAPRRMVDAHRPAMQRRIQPHG